MLAFGGKTVRNHLLETRTMCFLTLRLRDLSEAHFELKLWQRRSCVSPICKRKKLGSTFHNQTNAKPWGDGRWASRIKSWSTKQFSSPFPKYLWTGGASKTDQFSENSKQPLTPPPFSETYIAIFSENLCLKPCIKVQNLQYNFLDWKWPPPLWNFSENSPVLVPPPVRIVTILEYFYHFQAHPFFLARTK